VTDAPALLPCPWDGAPALQNDYYATDRTDGPFHGQRLPCSEVVCTKCGAHRSMIGLPSETLAYVHEQTHAQWQSRAAPPAAADGSDTPWPLRDVLTRLADAADHLLKDHSCDAHGYEGLGDARDAARRYAAMSKPAAAATTGDGERATWEATWGARIDSAVDSATNLAKDRDAWKQRAEKAEAGKLYAEQERDIFKGWCETHGIHEDVSFDDDVQEVLDETDDCCPGAVASLVIEARKERDAARAEVMNLRCKLDDVCEWLLEAELTSNKADDGYDFDAPLAANLRSRSRAYFECREKIRAALAASRAENKE
jgi:hypothetical protein